MVKYFLKKFLKKKLTHCGQHYFWIFSTTVWLLQKFHKLKLNCFVMNFEIRYLCLTNCNLVYSTWYLVINGGCKGFFFASSWGLGIKVLYQKSVILLLSLLSGRFLKMFRHLWEYVSPVPLAKLHASFHKIGEKLPEAYYFFYINYLLCFIIFFLKVLSMLTFVRCHLVVSNVLLHFLR